MGLFLFCHIWHIWHVILPELLFLKGSQYFGGSKMDSTKLTNKFKDINICNLLILSYKSGITGRCDHPVCGSLLAIYFLTAPQGGVVCLL